MEKIIVALTDTSVPTIITVSGIALLFLALAGRFGTYIEIRTERQNMAVLLGSLLFLTGVGLHAYPLLNEPSNPSSSARGHSNSSSMMFVLAGSYTIESNAEAQKQVLRANGIDAIVGNSEDYDFLCPGYFSVMVLAPNLEATGELLEKVRAIVPGAYPRNPATFDPSIC